MPSTIAGARPAAHSMDTAWLGLDADGHLAHFGAARAASPVAVQLEVLARAVGAPPLDDPVAPRGLRGLGLYVYEANPGRMAYVRGEGPRQPVVLTDVPPEVRAQLTFVLLPHLRFADLLELSDEHLPDAQPWSHPGQGSLSRDGRRRLAIPGHEDAFRITYGTDALELTVEEAEQRAQDVLRRVEAQSVRAARMGWSVAVLLALVAFAVVAWGL